MSGFNGLMSWRLNQESRSSASVLQLLDRALEEGQSAVKGLRSPDARKMSLGEAFAHIPEDSNFFSPASFRVVVSGRERQLRAGLRYAVYRIAREAIVNAFRHSRATEIETEIEYRRRELRIIVRDNGCGIDLLQMRRERSGHCGLHRMRERAEGIGGRVRVSSQTEVGTEVELCVPVLLEV